MPNTVFNFTCPICHSDEQVAGCKAHDGKRWWHKCCASEETHGDVQLPDGSVTPWPRPLWFTNDGFADTGVKPFHMVRISHQEMRDCEPT